MSQRNKLQESSGAFSLIGHDRVFPTRGMAGVISDQQETPHRHFVSFFSLHYRPSYLLVLQMNTDQKCWNLESSRGVR